jgi:hypothetical protein
MIMEMHLFSVSPSLSKSLEVKVHKTIKLPVVLYGAETWSLVLRRQYIKVFENRILRGIFGPDKGSSRRLGKIS